MSVLLRLYVRGGTEASQRAVRAAEALVGSFPNLSCSLEIVDIDQFPERAVKDRVVAVPTLIKINPAPVRKIIGDLSPSNPESLAQLLGLIALDRTAFQERR